jgi:hypothetical protein
MGNKPKIKFQAGNIQTAVWDNSGKGKDGKPFTYQTISLQRSYTIQENGKDVWKQESINLRRNDIIKILVVLEEANKYLLLGTKEDKEEPEESK